MAPKQKKGGNGGGKSADEEREEPLQALILADSYETRFAPFTLERPRCLLPLANTPLIEYTCEFLASAGVEEVYVYCGNHTDQVEEYIKNSKWTKDTSPFSLEIVRSTSRSIGDAMRDLDQKEIFTGDFLCVYGDVISNVPMEAALAAHRARREKDKKAIMTMLLREGGEQNRTKSQNARPVFVVDPEHDRCLHYEQMRPQQRNPRLNLEPEILAEHTEVEVRQDLIDCGIDICTPAVLGQWSEGFDWETPRRGFLHGVLKDHELNGLTIHTHIIEDHYAARVKTLQAYDAVSKDVLSRWSYPLCPDSNLVSSQSYQLLKGSTYKEDGVVLARSSVIKGRSVLGKATSVGDGTVISNSVIGRRCVIGKRVKIDGAYIWDDARIEDDTTVERAIVANEASIGRGCKVMPGALVSYGVKIADNIAVQGTSRITRLKRKRGQENVGAEENESDEKVVGHGGVGFELQMEEEDDDDEQPEGLLPTRTIYNMADMSLSSESISTLNSEDEDDEEHPQHEASSRSGSFTSIGSDDSTGAQKAAADFYHEASASIFDALQKGQDPDNIQIELKGLTLSSNAEGKQVRRSVAVGMMKRVASLMESGSTPQQAVSKTIPPNKLLVEKCVLDQNEEDKSEQVEFVLFMQTDLVHRKLGEKVLLFACNALATNDLVEAEGFEQWWDDPRSSASEELLQVRKETQPLVEALVGDSDEEESDDSESD